MAAANSDEEFEGGDARDGSDEEEDEQGFPKGSKVQPHTASHRTYVSLAFPLTGSRSPVVCAMCREALRGRGRYGGFLSEALLVYGCRLVVVACCRRFAWMVADGGWVWHGG